MLEVLGSEWTVLHAVPIGLTGTSIDHLAIGPGGVFAITTKNHTGARIWASGRELLVNGLRQNHGRAALADADRSARMLANAVGAQVEVTPLIIVANPASVTIGAARPIVTVLPSSGLYRFLHRHRRVLSAAAIADLAAAASDPHTWGAVETDSADSSIIVERFERLQREVDDARIRAFSWTAIGFAAATVPGIAFVATTVIPIWRAL